MSILCFDAGTKRIGVAVTETGIIATAIGFIHNNSSLEREVAKLVEKYNPGKIVIGLPLNMDGTKNSKTLFADELKAKIIKILPGIELVDWDERMTSKQAEETLIKGDVSRAKRKKLVDKMAAALILQNYIDRTGNKQ